MIYAKHPYKSRTVCSILVSRICVIGLVLAGCSPPPDAAQQFANAPTSCTRAKAVDGDTLRCGNLGLVRLLNIDAPEMPGHCRTGRVCTTGDGKAAKRHLAQLIAGHAVRCTGNAKDRYRRLLARCSAAGVDLSCAMVASGHAVERYGRLTCK